MKKIILILLCIMTPCVAFINEHNSPNYLCSQTQCYALLMPIGEGAFGEVFAAENAEGEKVAIKHYKDHQTRDNITDLFADANREFERGQLFDHPHIVKSLDLFEGHSQEDYYLVLQFIEGQPEKRARQERGEAAKIL